MELISEQVKELKEFAEKINQTYPTCEENHKLYDLLSNAANTIETLSSKLEEKNSQHPWYDEKEGYRHCEDCENFITLPDGVRGGKRGHCKRRYARDNRSGRARACKLFSEKTESK